MNSLLSSEMAKIGFTDVDLQEYRRLFICTSGKEKSGKSTFAFTAPGPMAVITADTGTMEACQRAIKIHGKQIVIFSYKVPDLSRIDINKRQEEYEPEWERLKTAIISVVRNMKIRTLIKDTGTELWELCRLARFGKIAQIKPQHYGPVNAEMRELMKMAYDRPDLNVVITHKAKKEYKESKTRPGETVWTGAMEMAGFSDMPYISDFSLWHYFKNPTSDEREEGIRGHFGIRIADCPRQNGHLIGEELEDDMCSFPFLAALIYPETSPSDWE